MAENSVGTISLDLIIQNNITGQLEKIKSNAERPVKQIGESIESAIESPIAKTAENIQEKLGSAFEGASKTAQKNVEKITKSIDNGIEKAVKEAEERLKAQEAKWSNAEIITVQEAIRRAEIERAKIAKTDSQTPRKKYMSYDTKAIEKEIEECGSKVDSKLQEIFDKAKNFKIPTTPVERLETELESTRIKTDLLQKKWQELSAAEPSEKVISQMLKIQQQIVSTQTASKRLESQLSELNKIDLSRLQLEYNELTSLLTTALKGLSNTALAPILAVVSGIKNIGKACHYAYEKIKYYLEHPLYAVRDAGKAAFSVIKKVGSKAFGILKSVGGKALDSLKSRFGFLNKSAISLTKPIKKLGTTLKNTFRRVFIMATLYAAVKAIKNSFSEILKSNDELSKSLNDIKANLSIAFTPIIQAIMPALNTMMSGLAKVTRYIAGFTAGLFGTTYKQAAEATQKLKNTGKTATDTAKKVKLSLAGIDEMNILSDNSDESANDEENSGIDYSNLDMSEPELPDWAERLKEAIKSGDWYGVGEVLAERVNAVFDGIDWESVEKKVTAGVNKICDFINGFVDNIDFEHLGNAFAGGLNIISSAANAFSDNIHWETIGSGLANGLNQAVNKIKWKQLGRSISSNIRILTDLIYSFVTDFNWKELGKGIGGTINGWFDGIDFGKLGTTLSEGIKGIFSAITATLQTVDFGSIDGKIAEFVNNIDIVGILVNFAISASELVKGMYDLLIGFIEKTDWLSLGDQIFDGIVGIIENYDWEGICERAAELLGSAVGGASALIGSILLKLWDALKEAWNSVKEYFNKKIEECGGNVIGGVFKGILDAFKNIGNWIKEHIFKPFIDGFKKAFGIHSPSREMAEMGGYIIAGLFNAISDGIAKIREIFEKMLETIKTVFSDIGEWFKDKFSSAWNGIKSVWNDVNGYFSGIWDGITFTFSVVGNWFGEKFQTAWNNIKNIFSEVKEFFEGVWNGITNVFSHVTNWFRDTFSDAWQAVKNVFSKGGEIFTGITDGIFNTFKTVVNGLIDGMNWVIEQPFNTINWALDGIRGIEILDWYPFEWLPSIDVPQIPRLANGGLATAPTLAMVGDNRNAKSDPEVIAPLSKLEGMIGDNSEITEMLKIIIELLKNGINIEIINYMFRNSREFSREVIKAVAEDNTRKGGK